MDRDVKPLVESLNVLSGDLKEPTHFVDKSRLMPVLWTIERAAWSSVTWNYCHVSPPIKRDVIIVINVIIIIIIINIIIIIIVIISNFGRSHSPFHPPKRTWFCA